MADMDIFLEDVESEVIGCPEQRIRRAVRSIVRYFCQETETWRLVDRGSVIEGVNEVALYIPDGVTTVTVHSVSMRDRPLTQVSASQMAMENPNWQRDTGSPEHYYLDSADVLRLIPVPDTTHILSLDFEISLKPTRTGNHLDDTWVERWYEILLHGVLGKLQAQRGMSWHDQKQADFNTSMFLGALDDARAHGQSNHVYRGVTTAYGGI